MVLFQAISFMVQAVLVLAVVACVAGGAVFVVEQQQAAVIERLGKFCRIAGAGIHVEIPFIDRVDLDMGASQADSGVYKSYYMLAASSVDRKRSESKWRF